MYKSVFIDKLIDSFKRTVDFERIANMYAKQGRELIVRFTPNFVIYLICKVK